MRRNEDAAVFFRVHARRRTHQLIERQGAPGVALAARALRRLGAGGAVQIQKGDPGLQFAPHVVIKPGFFQRAEPIVGGGEAAAQNILAPEGGLQKLHRVCSLFQSVQHGPGLGVTAELLKGRALAVQSRRLIPAKRFHGGKNVGTSLPVFGGQSGPPLIVHEVRRAAECIGVHEVDDRGRAAL